VERGQADLGGYAPPKGTGSVKKQALKDQVEIHDKLIGAFQSKPRPEWKKLLAFSKKWPELADGVFGRFVLYIQSERFAHVLDWLCCGTQNNATLPSDCADVSKRRDTNFFILVTLHGAFSSH
jgi:hypothetical protein